MGKVFAGREEKTNGDIGATVTFTGVTVTSGVTLNATYGGDSNYNGTTAPAVTIAVH